MPENQKIINTEMKGLEEKTASSDKQKRTGKKKKLVAAICIVFLLLAFVSGYFIYRNYTEIPLLTSEKTIEYGTPYYPDPADFVEKDKINSSYKITGFPENEQGKDYVAVGEYTLYISAEHKERQTVMLMVKDTVAPVFNDDVPTEVEVYKDCSIENIEETFKATDLSDVEITVDNENVDYATVGEYETNVYATDTSGNVASKEIKVIVKEPTITVDPINISMTVGENATITATIRGKEQTAVWSSSDESVATVDENGKVTAVKRGTVTITAKANNVEATTTVSVTNKSSSNNSISGNRTNSNNISSSGSNSRPSGSSSSSKPNSNSSNSNSSSGNSLSGTHQHSMSVGNMGRWFDNREKLISYYQGVVDEWNDKVNSGEISNEEYFSNVPMGYECWSCSSCGKWTGNFKYDR